jgi:glyoxylate reductase
MPTKLPLVLISHALPVDWLEKLAGHCQILAGPPEADHLAPELVQHLPDAVGILTLLTIPVSERVITNAPKLRVVSNMAVGYDNVDITACTRRGIPVGNTPGVLTEGTADLTLALLLAAARKLPQASQDARAGRWTTWSPTGWLGADLQGATLGIIGMGKIGSAVARRAAAFGMKIIYSNPSPRSEIEYTSMAMRKSFEKVIAESDFLSLHCPLTDETRGLIDAVALRAMKPNAILINASRGPVVVRTDLEHALREKWIAAAALDVTDPEPLPADDPLYDLPNCLIVPHIGSATQHTRKRMAELACENLLAGLRGERLPHCVNPEVYRNL